MRLKAEDKAKRKEGYIELYTDFLISQNQYATATGLSAITDGKVSHDQITRFLNNNEFSSKDLWKKVKKTVREIESENGYLIFDDTIQDDRAPGTRLRMGYNYSHLLGNLWSTGAKANIIKTQIGQNNHPVVVEYWFGGITDGHYSDISKYIYSESFGIKTLLVQTMDHNNSWYSISEPWMPETGVFFIEHY